MKKKSLTGEQIRFLAVVATIFILAVGMVVAAKINKTQVTPASAQLVEENNVSLTASGFSPKDIKVKSGTAVRWKNTTAKAASVNSDDYPTNKLYPELNLGKFETNQSLVHVFNAPGTYKYHNQMHPQDEGTVTVE